MVFHTNHFLVFSRHQNKPYEAALSPPFEGQPPCAGSSHIPNIHAKCLVCDALRPWEWVLALPLTGTEASFGRTRAPEGISPGPVPQAALCHKPPPALARARPCSPGTQPCGSSSAWASQEPGHRRRQRDQGLPPRPCKRPLQALPSAPQPCPSNAH